MIRGILVNSGMQLLRCTDQDNARCDDRPGSAIELVLRHRELRSRDHKAQKRQPYVGSLPLSLYNPQDAA
jgi:hypothetical protein